MIAVDMDGTVLASKSCLPEENVRALRRAMDAGVLVVICTGRMVESTVPLAEQIGVNAPLSVFNGAMVYDHRSRSILGGRCIPQKTAVQVLKMCEDRGLYVQAFPGEEFYLERRTAWTDYYEDKINGKGTETGMPLSEWLKTDVYKLLCLDEGGVLDAQLPELAAAFPEVSFIKSGETHLEIIARGVDKAYGLQSVCDLTGIRPEEVIAFGDEENDLPMIRLAGVGYVMENAPENILRQAKLIAPKNTDCGVARIVNMYLDEGRMGRG